MNMIINKIFYSRQTIHRATFFCLLAALSGGCASHRLEATKSSIEVSGDLEGVWSVCQRQIKNRGFELDRIDLRSGIIETYPLISKQWFEFWRNDVIDGDSLTQSSLHTVNRLVKLKIDKLDNNNYRLQCQVEKLKLYYDRDVKGAKVRAQETFAASQSQIFNNKYSGDNVKWLPAGIDPVLQQAILKDISSNLGAGGKSTR